MELASGSFFPIEATRKPPEEANMNEAQQLAAAQIRLQATREQLLAGQAAQADVKEASKNVFRANVRVLLSAHLPNDLNRIVMDYNRLPVDPHPDDVPM